MANLDKADANGWLLHRVAPDEWRVEVEHALRDCNQRLTEQRLVVLDWIADTGGPFTAETLVADMEAQHGSSRATIYRILEWLRSNGWIARVHSNPSQNSYICLVPGLAGKAVCSRCGTTFLFDTGDITQAMTTLVAALDFEMHGHVLELCGLCAHCRTPS
jgi:Fe2+ or Zn2+ uptake regulation protein